MSCYLNSTTAKYHQQFRQKRILFILLITITFLLGIYAVCKGAYQLSPLHVVHGLIGKAQGNPHLVVWNIRMPRIVAAIVAGWGLALSGIVLQTLLRNPLGSPSTLGISQGAAFGAAIGIILFNSGSAYSLYSVTLLAFLGAMAATVVILLLAKAKSLSSEAIILSGVALSSLFTSGTFLIQYFATETQVAAALFWTFGDVARSGWKEIGMMTAVIFIASIWGTYHRWNLNAMLSGEETAKGLGVSVESLRLQGMIFAALVSAIITAFHGVIAFLGLLAPHIAKRIVGADHRLLIPFSCVIGAILLLLADTMGRVLIGSGSMPVGILTSFMGAPMFLYLLMQGGKR
ncbi:MAG: iron ABC transporter permease [Desulfobacterium sp.]|nr:iron ABC transporter permease [Desulfobacterium sp.]MBU3948780.1 iron ABC transporter permease [Pseudomonadota bacterium]MBU4011335.1 iron ABC transporter permease [Pseudomonadota bacterium]MBU4037579.1 iron ABC transporter permease [Pseudomonadota bacterium]